MSNFISDTDYKAHVRDNQLQMIIDADDTILDTVELTAIAVVKDALYQYYDTAHIFAQTGTNRAPQVVRWCVCLAVYYLYERIPDKLVPERVKKNYDDTLVMLQEISDRKLSLDLPLKKDDEEKPISKFRWNSQTMREQQP